MIKRVADDVVKKRFMQLSGGQRHPPTRVCYTEIYRPLSRSERANINCFDKLNSISRTEFRGKQLVCVEGSHMTREKRKENIKNY